MGIIVVSLLKLAAVSSILNPIAASQECPAKCACRRTAAASDAPQWVKVRCGDPDEVRAFGELEFGGFASEVVQLNLSGNSLAEFAPKLRFDALKNLDLSDNRLVGLEDNQFVETPNLKRLDISGNQIKTVGRFAFRELRSLERLKLNNNLINTIEKGSFDGLENLKQLNLTNNPLTCDCDLLWLLKWAENTSVKLISNPKCASPPSFKGLSIKKLRIGEHVHCKSPAGNRNEVPLIEIAPNNGQVVFEGDSLKVNCRAPAVFESYDPIVNNIKNHIVWFWVGLDPKSVFASDVTIENKYLENIGSIESTLVISKLNRNHSGIWNCELTSSKYQSSGINIIVISSETKYCESVSTSNNKGNYIWPKTIANNSVSLPCRQQQPSLETPKQTAEYSCTESGKWMNLNTSACSYISETTRILEQFSKFTSALGKGGVMDSAKHFKNYISDMQLLSDVEDLVYAIRTVQSYVQFVTEEKDLAPVLMETVSLLMNLNESYIREACILDNSCNKLIKAMEGIALHSSSLALHEPNVAMETFTVKQTTFAGMTCTWYTANTNSPERVFYCATTNQIKGAPNEKVIEASVRIPSSFFQQLRKQDALQDKIVISMFGDGKLFPVRKPNEAIVSGVVGVKLGSSSIENLTEPINIMLKTLKRSDSDLIPVWWNETGFWTTDGCQLAEESVEYSIFKCHRLGFYALKQNTTSNESVKLFTKFKFSHSAIYIGSLILFMCLLTSILTYLFCYASIQMPRKAKHSLINIWFSIAILCFIYVFGIYQTEDLKLCQIIGLILHYLTLSSLLWMCVGVNGMYKRLRRNDRTLELQDDELGAEEHIKKPVIGLYFFGWGLALIVCGISSAVNMKEYASENYCFLSSEPALSALYVPLTILIITLCIYFSLIRCAMYSIVDTNGHLSEGTQATENVDLDLLEPNFPNNSIPSISTKSSSEAEDPEHAPIVQLKAYIIFLFIYVLTWVSCALSTVQPDKLKKFEEIFCVAYAIFAIVLGSFTVFFYCIARNDVRTQYVLLSKKIKRKKICFFVRSRNISDTSINRNVVVVPQIQVQPLPPIPVINEEDNLNSVRSSSRSSTNTKSNNSHTNKVIAKANDNTINNVNLVVLHRQQYRGNPVVPNLIENPTNSAEMFYNPHQSTVARKFFKKQKRNMMKHTNLVPKRTDFLNDTSSVASFPKTINDSIDHQSIFSTNSKVNNTNIHIEKIGRKQRNNTDNPNILLLDSYDEQEPIQDRKKRPIESKSRYKKKQNLPGKSFKTIQQTVADNMRSVSQQCTLDYSSEAVSDSILDQKSLSPEKSEIPVEEEPLKTEKVYEPSEEGSSVSARIYVNPSHEPLFPKRCVQSRASSVSASEIDELYQEIRGNKVKGGYKYDRMGQPSPCFSDSEITSGVSEVRYRNRRRFFREFGNGKVESNV